MNDLRQLTIPGAGLDVMRVGGPSAELVKSAREACDMVKAGGRSVATKKAYERATDRYAAWCDREGLVALPCSAFQLVTYLKWLSSQPGQNLPAVLQASSAIARLDRWARTTGEDDNPPSVVNSQIYKAWVSEYRLQHRDRPRKQAPVFHRADLERVIAAMDAPTKGAIAGRTWTVRAARDRALWLVGIAGALRVSELQALRVEDVQRAPEGLLVLIRSSKTDKRGVGHVIGIEPSAVHTLCPVRAWEAWLLERGEWSGPAWVAVHRNGELGGVAISKRTLQQILQDTAARAGVRVSSHSLRRVFATTAAHKRQRADRVMGHARWTRYETMRRYIDAQEVWRDNPTRGLFEGEW